MENIPIRYATLDELEFTDGYNTVSLVDEPATETDTFLFSKEKFSFKVASEERRLIMGVMMVADKHIPRTNENGEPFMMVFPKKVVERMAFKAMKDQRLKNVNVMHRPDMKVNGVSVVESYVYDSERHAEPKLFKGIEEGSWMVTLEVDDNELWSFIKENGITKLSLEGNFGLAEKEETPHSFEISDINRILKSELDTETKYKELKDILKNG